MKRIILLTSVIFAAIILIWGSVSFFSKKRSESGAKSAANEFVNTLTTGNTDASYNMFSENLKKQISKENWTTQLNDVSSKYRNPPSLKSLDSVDDAEATYGDGAAVYKAIYSFNIDKDAYEMHLIIINKDGTWQVDEFNSIKT